MEALQSLREHLGEAARLVRDLGQLEAATLEGEAALLEDVLRLVEPVLPIMAREVLDYHYQTDGRNGCNPVERSNVYGRGLVLVDGFERGGDGSGNRGTLEGTRLSIMLSVEGEDLGGRPRIVEHERVGTWSAWQGEPTTWCAGFDPYEDGEPTSSIGAVRILTVREAVERYDALDILNGLAFGLEDGKRRAGSRETDLRVRRGRVEAARAMLAAGGAL